LVACGGGDAPVPLAIDGGPTITTALPSLILTGSSFVPAGSSCPASNEYVIIGSLGPHELAYSNLTTHADGPVFDQLWVCNSEGGRVMHWQSNPISLAPGANTITVTMSGGGHSASDTVTVARSGG
jgi:hypothetical protein